MHQKEMVGANLIGNSIWKFSIYQFFDKDIGIWKDANNLNLAVQGIGTQKKLQGVHAKL